MTQTKLYPNPIVPLTESYHTDLIKSLQDPTEAAAYLEAALEATDIDMLLTVLGNLLEARSSQQPSPEMMQYQFDRLQELLQSQGTATLVTLVTLIDLLGLQLSVTPKLAEPSHP